MKLARIIGIVLALCVAGAFPFETFGNTSLAAGSAAIMPPPTPIVVPGTPTCADLNASANPAFAHIATDWGFRINRSGETPYDQSFPLINTAETILMGGAGPSPSRFVRVAAGGGTLSWHSNRAMTAVIVQGGPLGAFVYPYNPASFGGFPNSDGSGLFTPGGCAVIEHVTFCFQDLEPTSAPASVSGRVIDSYGRGISAAVLVLTNAQTAQTWAATTNSLGYFSIEGAPTGSFYTLTVEHRRYTFADGTRTFTLNEDLVGVDFTANP